MFVSNGDMFRDTWKRNFRGGDTFGFHMCNFHCWYLQLYLSDYLPLSTLCYIFAAASSGLPLGRKEGRKTEDSGHMPRKKTLLLDDKNNKKQNMKTKRKNVDVGKRCAPCTKCLINLRKLSISDNETWFVNLNSFRLFDLLIWICSNHRMVNPNKLKGICVSN